MDKRLHLLDTFGARGSDGQEYMVKAYEHMVHEPTAPMDENAWSSTGQIEYRLNDGRRVDEQRDGSMRIVDSDVELRR